MADELPPNDPGVPDRIDMDAIEARLQGKSDEELRAILMAHMKALEAMGLPPAVSCLIQHEDEDDVSLKPGWLRVLRCDFRQPGANSDTSGIALQLDEVVELEHDDIPDEITRFTLYLDPDQAGRLVRGLLMRGPVRLSPEDMADVRSVLPPPPAGDAD